MAAPRPAAFDACLVLAGLGLGAVTAMPLANVGSPFWHEPGALLVMAGRVGGMTGAYLMLVTILLVGRAPWIESTVGQDRLIRWHRWVGPLSLALIAGHVVTTVLGYAALGRTNAVGEVGTLVGHGSVMPEAAAAIGVMLGTGLLSVKWIRRALGHERWWLTHLTLYAALGLSLAHQFVMGADFVAHPVTQIFWIALWAVAFGTLLLFRIVRPAWRTWRHKLTVAGITLEAPGVYSVTLAGRRLDRLHVAGGQFMYWRFLTRSLWWEAHPYSLSAMPEPSQLRITVRTVGDHSTAIAQLPVGTRVAFEGPYGTFSRHRISAGARRVALFGAGVGITPLLALLQDLPPNSDPVLVVRARDRDHVPHYEELAALVQLAGGEMLHMFGSRDQWPLHAQQLRARIPDLAERDVYVCGPPTFANAVRQGALGVGLDRGRIHQEEFAF